MKKISIITKFCLVVVLSFSLLQPTAAVHAATIQELQQMVAALLEQIARLKQQQPDPVATTTVPVGINGGRIEAFASARQVTDIVTMNDDTTIVNGKLKAMPFARNLNKIELYVMSRSDRNDTPWSVFESLYIDVNGFEVRTVERGEEAWREVGERNGVPIYAVTVYAGNIVLPANRTQTYGVTIATGMGEAEDSWRVWVPENGVTTWSQQTGHVSYGPSDTFTYELAAGETYQAVTVEEDDVEITEQKLPNGLTEITYQVSFTVTAGNEPIYIKNTASFNEDGPGIFYELSTVATNTPAASVSATVTSDARSLEGVYRIGELDSEEFTLIVKQVATVSGNYRLTLETINYGYEPFYTINEMDSVEPTDEIMTPIKSVFVEPQTTPTGPRLETTVGLVTAANEIEVQRSTTADIRYSVTFTLTATATPLYLASVASTDVTRPGVVYRINGPSWVGNVPALSSNARQIGGNYVIAPRTTETFTLRVLQTATSSGEYSLSIARINVSPTTNYDRRTMRALSADQLVTPKRTISVSSPEMPDLVVTASATPATLVPGQATRLSWITNFGNVTGHICDIVSVRDGTRTVLGTMRVPNQGSTTTVPQWKGGTQISLEVVCRVITAFGTYTDSDTVTLQLQTEQQPTGPRFDSVVVDGPRATIGASYPRPAGSVATGPVRIGTVNWGDGTTQNLTTLVTGQRILQELTHTYKQPGRYTVTLVDANGQRATRPVVIENQLTNTPPSVNPIVPAPTATTTRPSTTTTPQPPTRPTPVATTTRPTTQTTPTPTPTPRVERPVCNAFTSSRQTITRGEFATLSWSTSHATSVSITRSQGSTEHAANGTLNVNPMETRTFTLTARGEGGTATCSVRITVNQPTSTGTTTGQVRGVSTDVFTQLASVLEALSVKLSTRE